MDSSCSCAHRARPAAPLLQTPAALTSSVPLERPSESKGASLETCSPGQLFESDPVDRQATGVGAASRSQAGALPSEKPDRLGDRRHSHHDLALLAQGRR